MVSQSSLVFSPEGGNLWPEWQTPLPWGWDFMARIADSTSLRVGIYGRNCRLHVLLSWVSADHSEPSSSPPFLGPQTSWSVVHVCVLGHFKSCPALCDPMDCSLPVSSVHGDPPGKNTGVGCHALTQRIFPTGDWTHASCIFCIAGGFFTPWSTGEAPDQ